jgi:hypothetical protein
VNAFDPCRREVDRVVERERAVENAAGDLPAVGHLAQRRGVDRRRHVGIDGFHRREDGHLGQRSTQGMCEIDRVLDDVHLVGERRGDVDGRIGDDQGLRQRRYVHHKAMTDAPFGPQPGFPLHHGAHQLVGVEAALHERLGLAFADQAYCVGG